MPPLSACGAAEPDEVLVISPISSPMKGHHNCLARDPQPPSSLGVIEVISVTSGPKVDPSGAWMPVAKPVSLLTGAGLKAVSDGFQKLGLGLLRLQPCRLIGFKV